MTDTRYIAGYDVRSGDTIMIPIEGCIFNVNPESIRDDVLATIQQKNEDLDILREFCEVNGASNQILNIISRIYGNTNDDIFQWKGADMLVIKDGTIWPLSQPWIEESIDIIIKKGQN